MQLVEYESGATNRALAVADRNLLRNGDFRLGEVTSGGATPFRKKSAQPKGGVRNEVCRFTQMSIASQTRSTPWETKTGRKSGTAM